jgi:hypothetical protein
MRIDVKINTDLFLKGRFKFPIQIANKISYPTIMLVILLAVADKDIGFKSMYETCHDSYT